MEQREIWHEVVVNVSPKELFHAITDARSLSHWWTTDVRGESEAGKELEFWFSGFCGAVMEVTELKPNELVRWKTVGGGATDWIGTEVEFRILTEEAKTILHFHHSKWNAEAKSFPHCSLGWAIFLISLKEFSETGKGRPHPYDMPINLWRPPAIVA